jgi:hypothetical protein
MIQMSFESLRIQDYGIIGDCRAAALIGRNGSLDWLCWPQFDSPAIFAGILDYERGGHWRIGPDAPYQAERRYVGESNVRELEPPGFLALNYGISTPLSVILAHAVFGAVLSGFYKLAQH